MLAVSRDRVRTVDVTARAMHRLLGLARVEIGTGRSDRERRAAACGSTGSPRPRAPRLREELLHRREPAPAPARRDRRGADAGARDRAGALDPRWVRYAPFTLSGLVSVGVVVGFLANLANEAHFDPERSARCATWPTASTARRSRSAIAALAALALVAVVVASTVGYALAFWDFRLTRHPAGPCT